MAQKCQPQKPFKRLRKILVWFAALITLLILTLVSAYAYFTQPQRLAKLTEQFIAETINLPVQIDRVEVDMRGNLGIFGLHLRVPLEDGPGAEIFSANRIALQVDTADIINGILQPQSIIIDQPILSLIELESGQFNYTVLQNHLNLQPAPDDAPTALPDQLPHIFIKEGLIRTGKIADGHTTFLGAKAVSGTLAPQGDEPGQYWFGLYEHTTISPITSPVAGTRLDTPSISGELDLRTLAVSTTVADIPFANLDQSLMPSALRQFWESLDPVGELKNIHFNLNAEEGFELIAEVHGVALTLLHLQEDGYTARMTDVNATFAFTDTQVRVQQLTGAIEGVAYEINGHYDGYSMDAPFTLQLKTEPFQLTPQPTYSVALPRAVTKVYDMFSPDGWVRVSSVIQRTKNAGPITTYGTTKIFSGRDVLRELLGNAPREQWAKLSRGFTPDDPRLNSHGHFHLFPYELTNARGLIRFDEKHVTIESLSGDTPNGGSATITGELGPLNDEIGIDVHVTALNIPFDEQLRNALKPHQQDALDMFFNQEHYDRLLAAGHFVTPEQRQADQDFARHIQNLIETDQSNNPAQKKRLAAQLQTLNDQLQKPVYTLGGRANVQVHVVRDIGPKQPINIHTDIHFIDAGAVFEHFPYPIRVTDGHMLLDPQGVHFKNVTGQGLNGGTGALNGVMPYRYREDGSKYIDPDLNLTAQNIPLDDLLLDALPENQKPWLEPLHMTGQLNVDGRIFLNDAKRFDIDMAIEMHHASITPSGGAFTINEVIGQLNLTLAGVNLSHLQGKRDDATIQIQGAADWADPQTASMRLDINAADLNFKDPVLDLVSMGAQQSPALTEFWDTYQPAGQFDAALTYETNAGQNPTYTLNLKPTNLAFTNRGQRVTLDQTKGQIQITPGLVQLQNFSGHFPTSDTLTLDGPIQLTPTLQAKLAIQASATNKKPSPISPQVLAIVPANLQALINTLQLRGNYKLDIPQLILEPNATHTPKIELKGTIDLNNATANLGIPLSDFNGRLAIDMTHHAVEPWPRIAIGIQADRIIILERPVTHFQMGITTADGSGKLTISPLAGDIAKGNLEGKGHIDMASGDYQLDLSVRDAQLKSLIVDKHPSATTTTTTTLPANSNIDGQVAASLALQGRWIDEAPIRGRGDVVIRNANLTATPLMLGILNVTHLQLPSGEAFDTANLNYYLNDGRFVFEQIGVRAPSMEIIGKGTLDWQDLGLDLTLTTQNPKGLDLGQITTIIDGVRNQLVTIRVGGTLNNPTLEARQFDGLSNTLDEIFGNGKKK